MAATGRVPSFLKGVQFEKLRKKVSLCDIKSSSKKGRRCLETGCRLLYPLYDVLCIHTSLISSKANKTLQGCCEVRTDAKREIQRGMEF